MKKKRKAFPLVFLIFGMVIIYIIAGSAIKRHISVSKQELVESNKSSSTEDKKSVDTSSDDNKDNSKIFFIKPETIPSRTLVKVYKDKRILELYGDEKLIGRFKIGLGRSPWEDKEKEGDNRTPIGKYYICSRNGSTKYTYFMGLSYPSIKDAQKGLEEGIINKDTYNRIKSAIESGQQPPWNTPLGGAVGIHGGGNKYDWTYGCIAMTNEDINILKQYTPLKTPVEIYK